MSIASYIQAFSSLAVHQHARTKWPHFLRLCSFLLAAVTHIFINTHLLI